MANNIPASRSDQSLGPIAFEGNPLIAIKNSDGSWGGWKGPLEMTTVTINPGENDDTTLSSHLIGGSAQRIGVISTPGDPTVSLKTVDGGPVVSTMAMKGTLSALTVTGATRTDEVIAVTEKGVWLDLGYLKVSATNFSGKLANDSALTAGTDYVLDDTMLKLGLIYIPSTSTITVPNSCKWTFTYGSVSGNSIAGNTRPDLRVRVKMLTFNTQTSKYGTLLIREAVLSTKTGPDFANNTFQESEFSGTLVTPTGSSEPYVFVDGLTL